MVSSQDKVFWMCHVALVGSLEITTGFVIIALPLMPKFAKSVKESWSTSVSSRSFLHAGLERTPKKASGNHGSIELVKTDNVDRKISTRRVQIGPSPSERYLTATESEQDVKVFPNIARTPSGDTNLTMV